MVCSDHISAGASLPGGWSITKTVEQSVSSNTFL
jgi:hypothetical protein